MGDQYTLQANVPWHSSGDNGVASTVDSDRILETDSGYNDKVLDEGASSSTTNEEGKSPIGATSNRDDLPKLATWEEYQSYLQEYDKVGAEGFRACARIRKMIVDKSNGASAQYDKEALALEKKGLKMPFKLNTMKEQDFEKQYGSVDLNAQSGWTTICLASNEEVYATLYRCAIENGCRNDKDLRRKLQEQRKKLPGKCPQVFLATEAIFQVPEIVAKNTGFAGSRPNPTQPIILSRLPLMQGRNIFDPSYVESVAARSNYERGLIEQEWGVIDYQRQVLANQREDQGNFQKSLGSILEFVKGTTSRAFDALEERASSVRAENEDLKNKLDASEKENAIKSKKIERLETECTIRRSEMEKLDLRLQDLQKKLHILNTEKEKKSIEQVILTTTKQIHEILLEFKATGKISR